MLKFEQWGLDEQHRNYAVYDGILKLGYINRADNEWYFLPKNVPLDCYQIYQVETFLSALNGIDWYKQRGQIIIPGSN